MDQERGTGVTGVHGGLVSLTDIDYGLDLANVLYEAGVSVSLYMERKNTCQALGDDQAPVRRIYELGLLPPSVSLQMFDARRMRDLRSIAVASELAESMRIHGVDLAHILVGSGEIWLAVLAWLLREIPVVSTMMVPEPNIGDKPPAFVVSGTNRILSIVSEMIIVNGASQVSQARKCYGMSEGGVAFAPLALRVTAARWTSGSSDEEPATILFFGRAEPRKGLEYLIRAQPLISRKIPDARIVIAAPGDDLDRCRAMIADPNRFEIIEEYLPGDEAASQFRSASLAARLLQVYVGVEKDGRQCT